MSIAEATDARQSLIDFGRRARAFLDANVPKLSDVAQDDLAGEARGPETIKREQALQATIYDAGFGNALNKIFQPFSQASSISSRFE